MMDVNYGESHSHGYPQTAAIEEVDSATPPSSPSNRGRNVPRPSNHGYLPTHLLSRSQNTARDNRSGAAPLAGKVKQRHTSLSRTYAQLLNRGLDYHSEDLDRDHIDGSDGHHTRRSKSHHRKSERSRSGVSESVSTLLVFTTERLGQETVRANAAEKRAAELVTHIRNANQAQEAVKKDMWKAREELRLYQIQLDLAQKEILRAQVTVDKVERARVEAEERAVRDRDRTRRVIEERAVERALEEGRRMGFQEGLERGRMLAYDQTRTSSRDRRRRRNSEVVVEEEDDEVTEDISSQSSPRTSTRTRSRRAYVPDVARHARHAQTLPIPLVTTPIPIRAPSTQPQPPNLTRPPSVGPNRPRSSSGTGPRPNPNPVPIPARSPEDIDIHPRSIHNRTPSVSGRSVRSIVVDPDIFIPTEGEHIPAPFEFSQRVPPSPVRSVPDLPRDRHRGVDRESTLDRDRDRDTLRDKGDGWDGPRVRDYAYPTGRKDRDRDRHYVPENDVFGRAGTMSTVSRGSTRISQYDLVSPPRASRVRGRDRGRDDRSATGSNHASERERRTPEQIVEEWRSANSDVLSTPTRAPATSRRTEVEGDDYFSLNLGQNTTLAASPRLRSPRVRGGPRRPRDVVLPIPLTVVLEGSDRRSDSHERPSSRASALSMPLADQSLRQGLHRRPTTSTIPDIDVEPPSQSPSVKSEGTIVDPIMLTPDGSHRMVALPNAYESVRRVARSVPRYANDTNNETVIAGTISDANFPPGFVPLSPIPGITNMNPNPIVFFHHASSHTSRSPRPTHYAVAPVPEGVVYPDPPVRPSTAADVASPTKSRSGTRRRVSSFGASPAPLNRPLSIFSDD